MVIEPYFQAGGITLYLGDNRDVIPAIPDAVSAVVTDPPAGISFMGKDWDHHKGGRDQWIAWLASVLAECERVMLPGAHALVWALPRTSGWTHRAIEDAGLDVRDSVLHLFGSGFPKSANVSKMIDKRRDDSDPVLAVTRWLNAEVKRAGIRYSAILEHFGFNAGSGQVGHWTALSFGAQPAVPTWDQWHQLKDLIGFGDDMDAEVWRLNGRKGQPGESWYEREVVGKSRGTSKIGGAVEATPWSVGASQAGIDLDITAPATPEAQQWDGWGTGLKPAAEYWYLARKPLTSTVAAQVLATGTGAINVDKCRVGTQIRETWGSGSANYKVSNPTPYKDTIHSVAGRWPPNTLLDPSAAAMLDQMSGERKVNTPGKLSRHESVGYEGGWGDRVPFGYNDTDTHNGASRFFPVLPVDDPDTLRFLYCPKASRADRGQGNIHPTCKPTSLMKWLITLVTPPDGTVLDPFAGSGTTGVACAALGFPAILIEQSEEYAEIAARRIEHALAERAATVRQIELAAD